MESKTPSKSHGASTTKGNSAEVYKRYNASPKGRARYRRYWKSLKRKLVKRKYLRSPGGRIVTSLYVTSPDCRLRNRLRMQERKQNVDSVRYR